MKNQPQTGGTTYSYNSFKIGIYSPYDRKISHLKLVLFMMLSPFTFSFEDIPVLSIIKHCLFFGSG